MRRDCKCIARTSHSLEGEKQFILTKTFPKICVEGRLQLMADLASMMIWLATIGPGTETLGKL